MMSEQPAAPKLSDVLPVVRQMLNQVMRDGSYSFGFLVDLAMADLVWRMNIFQIIHEIECMEGGNKISTTKAEEPFRGAVLAGYWHKHHTQASFMAHNMLNEMHKDGTVAKVLAPHAGKDVTMEIVQELTRAIVTDNYFRRSYEARLTGEWIVFSRAHGSNYYVTLAHHTDGDPAIAERISRYEAIDKIQQWDWKLSTITISDSVDHPDNQDSPQS